MAQGVSYTTKLSENIHPESVLIDLGLEKGVTAQGSSSAEGDRSRIIEVYFNFISGTLYIFIHQWYKDILVSLYFVHQS